VRVGSITAMAVAEYRYPLRRTKHVALLAQLVEHFHGKEGVVGSSPTEGFAQVQEDRGVNATMMPGARTSASKTRPSGQTVRRSWARWRRAARIRFLRRDRVLRRLVEELRVVTLDHMTPTPAADEPEYLKDEQRGEGAAQIVGPRVHQAGGLRRGLEDALAPVAPVVVLPDAAVAPREQVWTRFDATVQQLNQAGAGDNLADVVGAHAAVAQAASELADALQAAGECDAEAVVRRTPAGEHGSTKHPQVLRCMEKGGPSPGRHGCRCQAKAKGAAGAPCSISDCRPSCMGAGAVMSSVLPLHEGGPRAIAHERPFQVSRLAVPLATR
jgi:hypothetical protein